MDIDREALLPIFLAEAEERLASMEQCLVALESRPHDTELLGELFRAAHTLKGNSSSLGLNAVADLLHVLEDLLDRVRHGAVALGERLVTLLLDAVDLLRDRIARAVAGEEAPSPRQDMLVAALRSAAATGEAPAAPGPDGSADALVSLPGAGSARARGLRIGLEKLDRLLAVSGEIAIARGRIGGLLESLGEAGASVLEAHREAERLDRELHELVMRTRMVPLGPSFRAHVRSVRDIALSCGKQATLAVEGAEVEADLAVVEQLRDPLTHMIRNALDHGLETPAERRARGKSDGGTITLRARHEAGQLVVQVADDGAGLDRARILARARERGLAAEGQALSEREIHELIFRPGFSTAAAVTDLSGRGIGMDVVRRNIASLRGSVDVASRAGLGTTLTIRLPLTLAVIPGFLVAAGGERYVLPLESVVECLDLPPSEVPSARSGLAELRGEPVPYLRVGRYLGASDAAERESLVVVENGDGLAGLAVDGLLGEAQIVVQPLGHPLQAVPGVAGSTILGDGRVALILDVTALMHEARAEVRA
jgi:two-component system chemotaxis sensor kinase CheA